MLIAAKAARKHWCRKNSALLHRRTAAAAARDKRSPKEEEEAPLSPFPAPGFGVAAAKTWNEFHSVKKVTVVLYEAGGSGKEEKVSFIELRAVNCSNSSPDVSPFLPLPSWAFRLRLHRPPKEKTSLFLFP